MSLKPSRPGLRVVGSGDVRGERALAERILCEKPPIKPMPEARPQRDHVRLLTALLLLAGFLALGAVGIYATTLLSLNF